MKMHKKQWSIKTAIIKSKKQINFNPAYQREYEAPDKAGWQSKLIKSIFLQRDLPKIYLRVKDLGNDSLLMNETHLYECVDGQQRLRTLQDFQNDVFPLPKKCDVIYDRKVHELGGLYFSEIEELNDGALVDELFCDYSLDITFCCGSDSEMSDMFYDLNDLINMN